MNNLRKKIMDRFDKLNRMWQVLPTKKQRYYTLLILAGYTVLTLLVITKVCFDLGKSKDSINLEHIENPVIKKDGSTTLPADSITKILKNNIHGN